MRASLPALLPLIAAISIIASCENSSWDAPYRAYLKHLSSTLGTPPPEPDTQRPEQMPQRAALIYRFQADRLDSLDLLALRGCALQSTVAKRSSNLARAARHSQRLLLDLEYLQLAPGCIAQLLDDGERDLAVTLQQSWIEKRQQLPRRIFNATLAAEEYRALWRSRAPLQPYPTSTSSAVPKALEQIHDAAKRWLQGDYRFDNRDFEILLSEVATGDAGQLWQALAIQHAWLESGNVILALPPADGARCTENNRRSTADRLSKVTWRLFVDGIQPRASQMERRYRDLLPQLVKLEALLWQALPKPYRRWQSARNTALKALALAPHRHVRNLQQAIESCGNHRR